MTSQWNAYFWEFLKQTHNKHDWINISSCPYITFQHMLDYPDKPWDWSELSSNPNITFQHVLDYPNKPWSWYGLSYNPNITFQNILDYQNKPWDWDAILYKEFKKDKQMFIESLYQPSIAGIQFIDIPLEII